MPLPAELGRAELRRTLERVAHGLALLALIGLLIRSLTGAGAGPAVRARSVDLPAALVRWTIVERPSRIHASVDGDLSPAALDWLAALGSAGTPITWDGAPAPVAAINDAIADPEGGTRVLVAARAGSHIVLDDAFGRLDSLSAGRTGATFLARSGPSWVRARAGALSASAATPDSLIFGRLLVLGRVGWESKFVSAALEERGWKVDARLVLSPKGDVAPAGVIRLDTSRYSAVVVLDSVAPADLAAILPFIRSGGGAVLTAEALRAPALRGLGASGATILSSTEPFDTSAADPRRSLALWPIAGRPEQVSLESRGGQVAVAARRIERGRLLLVGYQDTWRWRMSGRAGAEGQHRDWWAGLAAGVARVDRSRRPAAALPVDEAPLAHLLDRLGPATPYPATSLAGRSLPSGLLFSIALGLLLLEWASRRLRGAP